MLLGPRDVGEGSDSGGLDREREAGAQSRERWGGGKFGPLGVGQLDIALLFGGGRLLPADLFVCFTGVPLTVARSCGA